jgi:hypothetical protein
VGTSMSQALMGIQASCRHQLTALPPMPDYFMPIFLNTRGQNGVGL